MLDRHLVIGCEPLDDPFTSKASNPAVLFASEWGVRPVIHAAVLDMSHTASTPNANCNAFGRTVANADRRKYPWDAAFQPERISFQRPAQWRRMVVSTQLFQMGPGQDESVVICLDDAFEILRVRKTTDKDEKRMSWYGLFLLGGTVQYGDCFKPFFPMYLGNLAPQAHLDIGCRPDLFNEVLRHRL